MKKLSISSRGAVLPLLLVAVLLLPAYSFASNPLPVFTASETVANVTVGTNDQTGATSPTLANTPETKATRTLTVATAPLTATSITIGSCVVSFATTTAGVDSTQDLNCNNNTARITTATTSSDIAKTTTQIANDLLALTNVSSAGTHGTLAITASTSATSVVFTTAGTESSATTIAFTDGTSNKIVTATGAGANVTGVIPVAQINTITVAGTVDASDVFSITIPTGVVSYTVPSTDTTTTNIATGINAALQATSTYASQAFTTGASTNTVVLTAKVAGTGFTQTSGTANRVAVAQQEVFTPTGISSPATFVVTINGTNYSYSGASSVSDLVTHLVSLITDPAVSCTQDGVTVTCTAVSAGTAFTYSVSATYPSSRQGGSGSGGGSSSATPASSGLAATIANLQAQIAALIAQMGGQSGGGATGSVTFSHNLTVGSSSSDVHGLQAYLNAHGFTVAQTGAGSPGHETTTFGNATKAALAKFQVSHGITPAAGFFGPKTRALLQSLGQ